MRFSLFSCYFWNLKTLQSSYYFFLNSYWDEFADLLAYYVGVVLEILFHENVEHVCYFLFDVVDSWQSPSLFSKWLSLLYSRYITNACFFGNSDFIIDRKWVCSAALLYLESIKAFSVLPFYYNEYWIFLFNNFLTPDFSLSFIILLATPQIIFCSAISLPLSL